MPLPENLGYDRQTTINAIRDYYQFLTKLYLPEQYLVEPPLGGWPHIHAENESVLALAKSPEITALLRHLPYIRPTSLPDFNPWWADVQAAPTSPFADWAQRLSQEYPKWDPETFAHKAETFKLIPENSLYFDSKVPEYVLPLTWGENGTERILLDTKVGVIYWYQCPDRIIYESEPKGMNGRFFTWEMEERENEPADRGLDEGEDQDQVEAHEDEDDETEDQSLQEGASQEGNGEDAESSEQEEEDPEEEWRRHSGVWPVADFFEMMKHNFRKLEFYPHSPSTCVYMTEIHGMKVGVRKREEIKEILREHGWPDFEGSQRKEECLAALKVFCDEHEP